MSIWIVCKGSKLRSHLTKFGEVRRVRLFVRTDSGWGGVPRHDIHAEPPAPEILVVDPPSREYVICKKCGWEIRTRGDALTNVLNALDGAGLDHITTAGLEEALKMDRQTHRYEPAVWRLDGSDATP